MLYRIITENKDGDKTKNLVADHFNSFTTYCAYGCWHSTWESSLIIEIDDNTLSIDTGYRVGVLAKLIKVQNKQEAVLVQEVPCKSSLI